jgi:hypothetical protein
MQGNDAGPTENLLRHRGVLKSKDHGMPAGRLGRKSKSAPRLTTKIATYIKQSVFRSALTS